MNSQEEEGIMKHEPKNAEFSAAGATDAPSLPAVGSAT
jgi:hypothetical protein